MEVAAAVGSTGRWARNPDVTKSFVKYRNEDIARGPEAFTPQEAWDTRSIC